MKNTENITIVLLLATAAILGAMLIATYRTETAQATGTSVKQLDYIMATAQWSKSTDMIYVVDIASRQMNIYFLNINSNAIEAVSSVDLSKAFK